jgi:hypothetical protein
VKLFVPIALIFLINPCLNGQARDHVKANSGAGLVKIGNPLAAEPGTDMISELYYKSVSIPNEIINGKEFISYFYRSKTNPFLFSALVFRATLYFNNRKYSDVKLQYDTFLDEVIYTDTTKMLNFEFPKICLNRELIDSFSFKFKGGIYKFINLKFPADSRNHPEDGFYEVAYDGPTRFIIRHMSAEYVRDGVNEYEYSPVSYFYIDGTYRKLTNMKDFIQMFGLRADEIKEYLHRKKIKIRKAGKNDIAEILRYYDSAVK